MRRYILCMLLVAFSCVANATKRALIIGIGDYPTVSGWAKINGDKDVPVVENMLLSNGFEPQNIAKLINHSATRAGITDALERLTAQVEEGDVVYIHFSGHGQQIKDIDGDEADELDEAWIPYDARAIYQEKVYEGENHILDDELYVWCYGIKKKIGERGNLIVVADACHSGDGWRSESDDDEEEEAVRGSFIPDLADASLVFLKKNNPTKKKAATKTQPVVDHIDWVFISACKAYQSNQEYQKAGSLTAAMAAMKGDLGSLSYDDLHKRLKRWMGDHLPRTQTPTLDRPANSNRTTLF